jgi:hypothetical protein
MSDAKSANAVEVLLTEVVAALGTALGEVCRNIEAHQTSKNFRTRNAGSALSQLADNVPVATVNRDAVAAVYRTIAASLNPALPPPPVILLRHDPADRKPPSTPE